MTSSRKATANNLPSLFSIEPKSDKDKICAEFGIVLPDHLIKKSLFENLIKEREAFVTLNECIAIDAEDEGLNLMKNCWLPSVLDDDLANPFPANAKAIIAPHVADQAIYQKAIRKSEKYFNKIFKDPSSFSDDEILNFMKLLCRVNAHHSVELLLTLYPNIVDLSVLLKDAIGCFHTETVTTLVKCGADIHKPLRHSDYSDDGYQIFGSALFYALMLPQEPYSTIGRFGPVLALDNPKYPKMLLCLLENGANPDQNCIFTDGKAYELNMAKEQEEEPEMNCRTQALNMLENEAFKKEASPELQSAINVIANWQLKPVEERRFSLS